MTAIAELFRTLRERAEHGEPIRATFERELVSRRPGDVLRLRMELDAMRETIDRALAGQLVIARERPSLFAIGECSGEWHTCACESCCAWRRGFESQHEGGRG